MQILHATWCKETAQQVFWQNWNRMHLFPVIFNWLKPVNMKQRRKENLEKSPTKLQKMPKGLTFKPWPRLDSTLQYWWHVLDHFDETEDLYTAPSIMYSQGKTQPDLHTMSKKDSWGRNNVWPWWSIWKIRTIEQFKLSMEFLVQYGVSLTLTRWLAAALQENRLPCDLETGPPSPNKW